MSTSRDPLLSLLSGARRVGGEYCWPSQHVLETIEAFDQLGLLLLGAELWRFEDLDEAPHVLGWVDLDPGPGAWPERVDAAARKATKELLGYATDQGAWVNFTWMAGGGANETD